MRGIGLRKKRLWSAPDPHQRLCSRTLQEAPHESEATQEQKGRCKNLACLDSLCTGHLCCHRARKSSFMPFILPQMTCSLFDHGGGRLCQGGQEFCFGLFLPNDFSKRDETDIFRSQLRVAILPKCILYPCKETPFVFNILTWTALAVTRYFTNSPFCAV